jgi:hypothetical protein
MTTWVFGGNTCMAEVLDVASPGRARKKLKHPRPTVPNEPQLGARIIQTI